MRERLIQQLRSIPAYTRLSIGVVTPFRAQASYIVGLLDQMRIVQGVAVGTVHKFQGDERDIMLFSPVVSRGIYQGTAKWVESPPNLVNVAITRARESLILVGDIVACRLQDGILGDFARYAENVELLRETSLDELELYSWMVMAGWSPEIHVPIGDIEVDFVLSNPEIGVKLVVEVEGRQHQNARAQDAARDAFLMAQGYAVLRFSTQDVRETPERIVDMIKTRYYAE
ncbi:MAG: AAA domain-containing protein [Candidatus Pelethousia sp.]|nr:AAA domain-containing protein [Candidatus Pelethousia sp.]